MPRMINVEKSQYLTQNIENFTNNKVGQYSKFIDKNPIFVTWLSINRVRTRNDVGTGGVESDVGKTSPIRFNRINGLPTYNIPELKPEPMYEENGFDISLDISDGLLLPNTVVPQVGDYLIIKLPNATELAFRVNEFRYNTIQSNDFYQYSADMKFTGKNLINRFESQIVDEFETIFDNIGTEDKCLITERCHLHPARRYAQFSSSDRIQDESRRPSHSGYSPGSAPVCRRFLHEHPSP